MTRDPYRAMLRWERKHGSMNDLVYISCASCRRIRPKWAVRYNPRFAESRNRAEAIAISNAAREECPRCGLWPVRVGTLDELFPGPGLPLPGVASWDQMAGRPSSPVRSMWFTLDARMP